LSFETATQRSRQLPNADCRKSWDLVVEEVGVLAAKTVVACREVRVEKVRHALAERVARFLQEREPPLLHGARVDAAARRELLEDRGGLRVERGLGDDVEEGVERRVQAVAHDPVDVSGRAAEGRAAEQVLRGRAVERVVRRRERELVRVGDGERLRRDEAVGVADLDRHRVRFGVRRRRQVERAALVEVRFEDEAAPQDLGAGGEAISPDLDRDLRVGREPGLAGGRAAQGGDVRDRRRATVQAQRRARACMHHPSTVCPLRQRGKNSLRGGHSSTFRGALSSAFRATDSQ